MHTDGDCVSKRRKDEKYTAVIIFLFPHWLHCIILSCPPFVIRHPTRSLTMSPAHSASYYTREQRFNDKLPLSIVSSLAVIQMLTTLAICAFEIAHNILNF